MTNQAIAEALARAADHWLELTGSEAVYRTPQEDIAITVTLEKDVEVIDEQGLASTVTVANLRSGVISNPQVGDQIVIGEGHWLVEAHLDDPGYIQRLYVNPE